MIIEPFYCDLHIHTYSDANKRNGAKYDIKKLIDRVKEGSRNHVAMISLTDHNTINKDAYSEFVNGDYSDIVAILGVELHVKSNGTKPYHAHAYFSADPSDEKKIDEINLILDRLYPNKLPSKNDPIPSLPNILNELRKYEFLFLPHGGQSHSTFDNAVGENELFDDVMMRSVYYNTFDGFTARSSTNIGDTEKYFSKIGINEFTGLITGSDNYDPSIYPSPKSEDAEEFTPSWIFSSANFDGLRMALSEKGRIFYSQEPPNGGLTSVPSIEGIELKNKNIDIDVELSSGLNVIIGGSSTGKTLLLEAIARETGILESVDFHHFYDKFEIDNITLRRNDNQSPYYVNQSFIGKVVDKSVNHETIEDIQILKDVFPQDQDAYAELEANFGNVRKLVSDLFNAAEEVNVAEQALHRLSIPSDLITEDSSSSNPISLLIPDATLISSFAWKQSVETATETALSDLDSEFSGNPLLLSIDKEINALKDKITEGKKIIALEQKLRLILESEERIYAEAESTAKEDDKQKKSNFKSVLENVTKLRKGLISFNDAKNKLLLQSFQDKPKQIELAGHNLSVIYSFSMSSDKLLNAINQLLNVDYKFEKMEDLTAEKLAKSLKGIDGRTKIKTLGLMAEKVSSILENEKTRDFSIETRDGDNWDNLSEGRKTAVLLDLILEYKGNTASLIIDQPEDNLAADYINSGLTKAIKDSKATRQTLIVTHNATIPMLADAQTIVLCRNDNGKLLIRSAPLEGDIDGKRVLDWIVEITDGGEPSVQKRFRKYNFNRFGGR